MVLCQYTVHANCNDCVTYMYVSLFLSIAPSVPITNFHITVLNSTAVEATWRPPTSTADIGGEIRGYKLVVDKINGTVTIININDEFLRYYIVKDLEPSATYLFSIILYTVGDGPQSVRLQVTMPDGSEHTSAVTVSVPCIPHFLSQRTVCMILFFSMGVCPYTVSISTQGRPVARPKVHSVTVLNGTAQGLLVPVIYRFQSTHFKVWCLRKRSGIHHCVHLYRWLQCTLWLSGERCNVCLEIC